jgi:formylglycine-generating enzyme required for sulfatase activity
LPAEKRPVELVFLVTCDVSVQTRDAARARSGSAFRCAFIASTELDEKVRRHPELVQQFFRTAQAGVNFDIQTEAPVYVGGTHQHFETPPPKPALPVEEAERRYLKHLIAVHQNLRLQGISAGSQPLNVALEKVYISLTARDRQSGSLEKARPAAPDTEIPMAGDWTIGQAMQRHRRLVVTGDPGCGKTTLLAYLALTYARTRLGEGSLVQQRLGLEENLLPIHLPLRSLGQHLKASRPDSSQDGPGVLLDYLQLYYHAQKIDLPEGFFEPHLEGGQAILLLDGMDELAEKALRVRVARLVENFAQCYPSCRSVVTSRKVGYEGAARLGEGFGLAEVRDFTPAQVRQFVHDWTITVETSLANSAEPEILSLAEAQAERLAQAIESSPRVAELAVNPLLLTVVALVHRYRAQLPARRSELYEQAVEVLLGNWDQAKGLQTVLELSGRELDAGDRRSLLEPVAFWLHERKRREIELDELRRLLLEHFQAITGGSKAEASKALRAFLDAIHERSGLLVERGIGEYSFAHLTFQEYLAARALADREDSVAYTLKVLHDPWWREVILLQAGSLSTQGKTRVTQLIQAIIDAPVGEEAGFAHLLLAAECVYDTGPARLQGDLLGKVRRRLKPHAEAPIDKGKQPQILRKVQAMNALARIETGSFQSSFWQPPWGEPAWVEIPAGPFWMGTREEDIPQLMRKFGRDKEYYLHEVPLHRMDLPTFWIARTPVTNAQYAMFINQTGAKAPGTWRGSQPPKGLEDHPVVSVSWHEALAYCRWLSEKIGKEVTLPSEAEWEKAARGPEGARVFPWGNDWRELHCNSVELGLQDTTPVGLFLNGASPYGVLDLSGNVWEWTRSLFVEENDRAYLYPYHPEDGRERLEASDRCPRVLRGGAFYYGAWHVRCAGRGTDFPLYLLRHYGFRVCLPHAP